MSETNVRRAALEDAMAKHETQQKLRRPLLWLAGLIVTGGAIVGSYVAVSAFSDSLALPVGDPGGKILHEVVSSVSETVPSGAEILSHRFTEPKWHNCSADRPAGYGDVKEVLVFRTSTAPSVVGTSVGALMAKHGWRYEGRVGILSWNKNFTLSERNLFAFFSEEVSLQSTVASGGNATISTLEASAGAFGSASAFCGGPS